MDLDLIKTWADDFKDLALQHQGMIYHPLDYAWAPHAQYVERYGLQPRPRQIFMLGINPGPWGMAQSGVPFGDVHFVKTWMGVNAPVQQPDQFHPKRPIKGFELTRREGSGKRLWGWANEQFGPAEAFFAHTFVWNYCPLMFLAHNAVKNITPDKLKKHDRTLLYALSDQMLKHWLEYLRPTYAIGVGAFATARLQHVWGNQCTIIQILHPSPANPKANKDWQGTMKAQCLEVGLNWNALSTH